MRIYLYLLFATISCLLFSCSKNLQDDAVSFAEDGKVTKEEVMQLLDKVSHQTELNESPLFYTDGKLDTLKMSDYLVNLYKTMEMNVSEVWRPSLSSKIAAINFATNIYIENSLSIDGYVNGNTTFKDAIYSMLGDFRITFPGALNLNYLNKNIPYHVDHADEAMLRSFIANLTPAEFASKGGNRTSSDISDLLQQVLNRTDDKNLSILVSDFVFSPGRKINAHNYLVNQSIGIRDELAQKIKTFPLAIEVLQLTSAFDGEYYDLYDHPTRLQANRPFYIWLIGNQNQITAVIKSHILEKLKAVDHQLFFTLRNEPTSTPFKILLSGKQGDFTLTDAHSGEINEASPADGTAGKFDFEIAANYGTELLGKEFFDDTSNFSHNPDYKIKISSIADTSDVITKGYTHKIHFSTNSLHKEEINLIAKNQMPAWVSQLSSSDDENISQKPDEQMKTFGLSYLIQGLYDSFYMEYHETTISIELILL